MGSYIVVLCAHILEIRASSSVNEKVRCNKALFSCGKKGYCLQINIGGKQKNKRHVQIYFFPNSETVSYFFSFPIYQKFSECYLIFSLEIKNVFYFDNHHPCHSCRRHYQQSGGGVWKKRENMFSSKIRGIFYFTHHVIIII